MYRPIIECREQMDVVSGHRVAIGTRINFSRAAASALSLARLPNAYQPHLADEASSSR